MTTTISQSAIASTVFVFPATREPTGYTGPDVVFVGEDPAPEPRRTPPFPLVRARGVRVLGVLLPPRAGAPVAGGSW